MLSGREGNRRFVVALAIDPSSTYGLGIAYDRAPRLPSTGVWHLNRYFVLQHEVARAILALRTIVVRVESGSRAATRRHHGGGGGLFGAKPTLVWPCKHPSRVAL